jgi:ADP-ribosylglycohydrolase
LRFRERSACWFTDAKRSAESRSVPEAIIAFLESADYEDAVRKAVSLGGDVDTLACMAGGIAEAYYKKLPSRIVRRSRRILDKELRAIVDEFSDRYG